MSLQWRMWTESSEERGQLERILKKSPKTDIERRAADIYHLLLPPLLHIWKFLQTPSSPVFPSLSLSVLSPLEIMSVACGTQLATYLIQFQKPWITPVCPPDWLCALSLQACTTLVVLNKNISVNCSLVSTAHEYVKTVASLQGQDNTPQPNA